MATFTVASPTLRKGPADAVVITLVETPKTAKAKGGELAGAGLDVFEHEPAVNPSSPGSRATARSCCCRT